MSGLKVVVCGVLCIQFLLSLLEGSSFHKYVKLFGYLIIMYMCCSLIFSVFSKLPEGAGVALEQMEEAEKYLFWGQK